MEGPKPQAMCSAGVSRGWAWGGCAVPSLGASGKIKFREISHVNLYILVFFGIGCLGQQGQALAWEHLSHRYAYAKCLLEICKIIYTDMQDITGIPFPADTLDTSYRYLRYFLKIPYAQYSV